MATTEKTTTKKKTTKKKATTKKATTKKATTKKATTKKATTKKAASKKATTKKTTKRRSKKAENAHKELWESLYEKIDRDKVVTYSMIGQFSAGVAIEHAKFGLGVVTESLPSKVEVVFEAGVKSLVHGRD